MRTNYLLLPLLTLPALRLAAQQAPTSSDTINARALPSATVVGYGQRLPLRRTAAGVGVIDQTIIQRFNESSLASAVNTLPGVRLEERATASGYHCGARRPASESSTRLSFSGLMKARWPQP
jgi:iron complex outermembrane receptor protein